MKQFNTTAVCIPSKHYMVDISARVEEIKKLVDAGKYFTINRARQYGKTTTLSALRKTLEKTSNVASISFEKISEAGFATEQSFVKAFCRLIKREARNGLSIPSESMTQIEGYLNRETNEAKLDELFDTLVEWCRLSTKPVVLIIDEVDTATNNQVFLDFLGQLRSYYLDREEKETVTFQSVILAGVTDVKHLKNKIRTEDDSKENSPSRKCPLPSVGGQSVATCKITKGDVAPWNIAADFTIDMSLSEDGIKGMLEEYEADHHTGMNTGAIAKSIREYTNGYPFLVSRICQLIDEEVSKTMTPADAWTDRGIDEAVKLILAENNTLFQSLTKNLNNYPDLKAAIRSILMEGTKLTWNGQQDAIVQMQMYGLIRNDHYSVRVANRIFETRLYNLFLSDEELKNNVFSREGELAKNIFIEDGKLNMRLIMERFIETYTEVVGPLKERFREKDGREQFLLYLKPIINGTGNYYIEAQTRDQTRTDVIVDYLGQQYIIELKIWRGERYNAAGEKQISEYLDYWHLNTGYMLSFNFNKKKEQGVHPVHVGDKLLYEGTV